MSLFWQIILFIFVAYVAVLVGVGFLMHLGMKLEAHKAKVEGAKRSADYDKLFGGKN